MQYHDLVEKLGDKERVFLKRSQLQVRAVRRADYIGVVLHETEIMQFWPDGRIALFAGQWRTVTTKARLNDYLPKPWRVYQDHSAWIVSNYETGQEWGFADGLTIHADGRITQDGELKATRKLNKQINKYVKGYVAALLTGQVPEPSQGDCWMCYMGLPDNGGHLLSHIEEQYYVPSLLMRATDSGEKLCNVSRWTLSFLWHGGQRPSDWGFSILERDVTSVLRRYMKRQLGVPT